jgi:hypothetical protein
MSDGDLEDLPFFSLMRKAGPVVFDPDVDELAEELEILIPQHGARQEAQFEQHLEAVADADHEPAPVGEILDFPHQRRKPCDGSGPQIIAISKSPRQDDTVHPLEVMVLVPEVRCRLPDDVLQGMERIKIAVGTRKNDDSEFHFRYSLFSI